MPTAEEILAQVRDHLGKGDVVAAKAAAAQTPGAAPAVAKPAAPPKPRTFPEVVLDTFKGVHNLLGTNPALLPLINELAEIVAELTPPPTS
jgi:hypothetical protein